MTHVALTQARLRQVVSYDPESGIFTRLEAISNAPAGEVHPRTDKGGYLRMRIEGRLYYMHRLAWLYVNGSWPTSLLDHADGDRANNQISNIREASCKQNLQNIPAASKAKSGLRGAYFDRASGKWQAKIMVDYKSISGGYHETPERAHQAYLALKAAHHKFQPEFNR